MPTTQRVALKAVGVSHRTQFAELGQLPDVDGAGTGALRRSQLQARLQVESERVRADPLRALGPRSRP